MSTHRLAGMGFVAMLHMALIALLLRAGLVQRIFEPAHETILILTPPKPVRNDKPSAPPPPIPVPEAHVPNAQALPQPQAAPGVDLKALENFGRALLDCRPENIANLPPEQRDKCNALSLKPRDDVDFADHSDRSRDAALWARGRARKNAPALLPCMSNRGIGVGLGTLLCLGKGLGDGFKPEEQPIYGDRPDEVHVPNNGDPHPAYTDPDH